MKKTLLLHIFILLILSVASGQQNPQFSQYLFNGVAINPAYAGSKGALNINALYRTQWKGIEGAPVTQTATADAPFGNAGLSAGLVFIHDELGKQRQSSLYGNFSSRIKISSSGNLAAGVGLGMVRYGLDGNELITNTPNDPSVPGEKVQLWRPDIKIGLYFNTQKMFAGISVSDLISGINFDDRFIPRPYPHLFLTSGFVFPLSGAFKLRPSLMVREDFKGPTNGDITGFIIYRDRIWLGASYRTRVFKKDELNDNLKAQDAIGLQIQLFPTEQFRIGYGYDFTTTALSRYNTHEISLGYLFLDPAKSGMLTPRYF